MRQDGEVPLPSDVGDVTGTPPPAGRRRRRVVVAAAVALAAMAAAAVGIIALGDGPTPGVVVDSAGSMAAPFDLPEVRDPGVRVSLTSLEGTPVVMNFFASTCVPCRTEMPDFQEVADQLGPRVAFVGIDHQDGRAGAQELLAETGVRYPAGYDPRGEVARAYGLVGLPTTVFISADGRVVGRRTGAMSKLELRRTIDRLFPESVERPR